jgi:hypothetical protein
MKISLIGLAAACAMASFVFGQFDLPPVVPPHWALTDLPPVVPPHGT